MSQRAPRASPNRPRKKDFNGFYFPMPGEWFDTPEYRRLSPMATKVFLAACMQYRGNNNGNISLPLSYLKGWQCTGNRQRYAAIAELANAGFLIRTKRGGLRMGPDLFAISFKPIDPCIDPKTGASKHESRPGGGLLHLWQPNRADLREVMTIPKKRNKPAPRIAQKDATPRLRASAGADVTAPRASAED